MNHNMFQMKKITFMPLYILKIIDYTFLKKRKRALHTTTNIFKANSNISVQKEYLYAYRNIDEFRITES